MLLYLQLREQKFTDMHTGHRAVAHCVPFKGPGTSKTWLLMISRMIYSPLLEGLRQIRSVQGITWLVIC